VSAPKLLGDNLLETATSVTTSTIASGSTATRLYDRAKSPLCTAGGSAAEWQIKVDLSASPSALTEFSLHAHNFSVVGITLESSPDDITYTVRDTFTGVSGTDVFRTIGTQTIRYWMLRVPSFSGTPAIGEFFLGAAVSISVEPAYDPGPQDVREGNVAMVESVGGVVRKVRLGTMRRGFGWTWNVLPGADWDNLTTWFEDVGEGAKQFPLLDVDGSARWVELVPPRLEARRVHKLADGTFLRVVALTFREGL